MTVKSLADLSRAMDLPVSDDREFSIHRLDRLHREYPVKSPLFRTDYYSLVLIVEGRGKYIVDHESYETRSGTLYLTNPGHLKGFEIEIRPRGFLITLSEVFLKKNIAGNVFEDFAFLIEESAPPHYLNEVQLKKYLALFQEINNVFAERSKYREKIVGNLVSVLLLRLKEDFRDRRITGKQVRSSRIVGTFKQSLEKHFRDLRKRKVTRQYKVKDFAGQQFITPGYLNTVVKSHTGKSANTLISEKCTAEAMTLLTRSDMSVQEVSSLLGYGDASHFSKFFKKHTGLSPIEYRKR